MSTTKKAAEKIRGMLAEVATAEKRLAQAQRLLGVACRELRLAHGLTRMAVGQRYWHRPKTVDELERSCTAQEARLYRAAVLDLVKGGRP